MNAIFGCIATIWNQMHKMTTPKFKPMPYLNSKLHKSIIGSKFATKEPTMQPKMDISILAIS